MTKRLEEIWKIEDMNDFICAMDDYIQKNVNMVIILVP